MCFTRMCKSIAFSLDRFSTGPRLVGQGDVMCQTKNVCSSHEGGIFDVILVAFWPAADFYFIVSLVKEIKLLQIYLALSRCRFRQQTTLISLGVRSLCNRSSRFSACSNQFTKQERNVCKFTETVKVMTATPQLVLLQYKSDFIIHTSNRICLNRDTSQYHQINI